MDSKTNLFQFIILVWISCSWPFLGSSQADSSLPCIQKLLPCQPYLKPPSSPPATCCAALTDMITGDQGCLCQIFNNQDLLKKFNITQDDALKLPKACGAKADTSLCQKGAAAPSDSPSTPGTPSNSSSASQNTTTTPKNAANLVAYSSGSAFTLLIVSLILEAI